MSALLAAWESLERQGLGGRGASRGSHASPGAPFGDVLRHPLCSFPAWLSPCSLVPGAAGAPRAAAEQAGKAFAPTQQRRTVQGELVDGGYRGRLGEKGGMMHKTRSCSCQA